MLPPLPLEPGVGRVVAGGGIGPGADLRRGEADFPDIATIPECGTDESLPSRAGESGRDVRIVERVGVGFVGDQGDLHRVPPFGRKILRHEL